MKKLVLGLILFAFSSVAFSVDDTQIFHQVRGPKLHYSLGSDSFVDRDGYETQKGYWFGIGNGPLHVKFNDKLDYYQINFSENVATLIYLNPTIPVYDLIKRFHLDVAAETAHDTYGLLSFQNAIYGPADLLIAGQFAKKGKNRVVVGGKVVYRADEVSLLYIPRMSDPAEEQLEVKPIPVVNGTVQVKVKFREFDNVWIDADGFYKMVNPDSEFAQDFSPVGWKATLGYWKMWGSYGVIPYFENLPIYKTGYEVGLNCDF